MTLLESFHVCDESFKLPGLDLLFIGLFGGRKIPQINIVIHGTEIAHLVERLQDPDR
ncbi:MULTISPECIES: hypothetical protein [Agrobacterium]|uniref:hypothetical protein n=1 Tax=Agrobacterium TaxID=357 RepID=UPI0027BACC62|nr:hypothetical protein [Agrobacterium sp. SORGH_AS_0745]